MRTYRQLDQQTEAVRRVMARTPGEKHSRQILAELRMSPDDVRRIRLRIEGPNLHEFDEAALSSGWGGCRK
jgi:hypothetical protein